MTLAHALAPLAFAVPLLTAALIAGVGARVPKPVIPVVSLAAMLFALAACAELVRASASGTVVHWFGGWTPRHDVALGIAFVVEPIGASLAALTSLLVVGALAFAWTYYDEAGPPFHALMLAFAAALIGFFLTGDLFNLFVFFELMGVAAFALTGFRSEDESAVEGAFVFAVVNSLAAFLVLVGIGLVYARTGALNMAQIAHALAGTPADPLVLLAFVLIAVGFGVKGALVPFHFWLADAHAVAPTPLCVLFSGIMVQAGLFAIARTWSSVFAGSLAHDDAALRAVLIGFGLVTAGVGAQMAFVQRHLKRMLAFSTIAHSGILVCGIGLLNASGIGGFAGYVIGHGLVKGGLFMCSGILLNRLGRLDIEQLRGKLTGGWRAVAAALAFGALGLAGLPPFGTYLGKALIDDGSRELGVGWLAYALLVPAAVTGAAILKAVGRMAFGVGPPPDPAVQSPQHEAAEAKEQDAGTPFVMYGAAVALLVLAFAAGLVVPAGALLHAAGERFVDHQRLVAVTLSRAAAAPLRVAAAPDLASAAWSGVAATVAAFALAAASLGAYRFPAGLRALGRAASVPVRGLRALHTGLVTDNVAWLVAGTVAFGVALVGLTR